MLSGLLTARCPPVLDWQAEAGTGLHLMGTSDSCKHKWAGCHYCAPLWALKRCWQVECDSGERRRSGVVFLNYGFRGLLGFTSCEEGELENVEWTVAGVFSVLDKCCRSKLTIHYLFSQVPHQFIWAGENSWSYQVSLAVTANPIYHDTFSMSLTPTYSTNMITRAFVAVTACWNQTKASSDQTL